MKAKVGVPLGRAPGQAHAQAIRAPARTSIQLRCTSTRAVPLLYGLHPSDLVPFIPGAQHLDCAFPIATEAHQLFSPFPLAPMKCPSSCHTFHVQEFEVQHLGHYLIAKASKNRCSQQDICASLKGQPLGRAHLIAEMKHGKHDEFPELILVDSELQASCSMDLRRCMKKQKFVSHTSTPCYCEHILATALTICHQDKSVIDRLSDLSQTIKMATIDEEHPLQR